MRAVLAFIRLGRPLFLGGGVILYALGAAVAAWHGASIDAHRYVLGQLAVTAFQLMTHYANDYFDYDADRANQTPTRWSGGSRVLANDELPRHVALVAALVLAALGFSVTAMLATTTDAARWTAPLFVAIFALAWAYSAPPFRLCASGLGELDTALVVTGLVPFVAFYLQSPDLAGAAMLVAALVAPALLQIAMLVAIEFPDAAGDAATGKRTLVVRLGAARAAHLYNALTASAYAWLSIAAMLDLLPARIALAAALPFPLALWRIGRTRDDHRDPAAHERLTFFAVALLVATSACMLVAFVVLR